MANKTLNTRIKLKYDLLANWSAQNPVLLKGELAIVQVPEGSNASTNEPAYLMKVGDGSNAFNSLPFITGLAGDVYNWAKAASKPTYAATEITGMGDFISTYVTDTLGIEVDTDTQYRCVVNDDGHGFKLQSKAKGEADTAFADVSTISLTFVKEIKESTVNGSIAVDGVDVPVHGLGSAAFTDSSAYDVKGAADTAETNAKKYVDDKIGTLPEGSATVVAAIEAAKKAATYDDTALKDRITTVEEQLDFSDLNLNLGKKDENEQVVYEQPKSIADLYIGISHDIQAVQDNNDEAFDEISKFVTKLVGEDMPKDKTEAKDIIAELKSVRTIANEELTKQLIPENAQESLDTLQEIAAWIQAHPADASAMSQKIADLESAVGEGGSVASQIDAKIEALKLAETYDAKGSAADAQTAAEAKAAELATAAETAAKNYADSLADNYDTAGAADTVKTAIMGSDNDTVSSETIKGLGKRIAAFETKVEEALGGSAPVPVSVQIENAIGALDVAEAIVGADETLATIKEEDGKISHTTQKIAITAAQVSGLADIATSGNINDLVQGDGDYVVFNCGDASTVI